MSKPISTANANTSNPLVTFVVPCYNYAHLLPKCVNSILAQDYANLEILIMDNASPDSTPEVARSFADPRVRHVRNEVNIGAVGNFNKGLQLASGKYVWVLSADDLLRRTQVVSRYVEVMEQNPDLGFAFCRAIEIREQQEGGVIAWADLGEEDRVWHDSSFFLKLTEGCSVVLSSAMMRKDCFAVSGVFPLDLRFADDWALFTSLALHFGAAYFAEPMVFHRVHGASLTTQFGSDYARICAGDEFAVLWRVGRGAYSAGKMSLHDASRSAFLARARHLLMSGLQGLDPHITATDFDQILADRVQDPPAIRDLRQHVYAGLASEVRSLTDQIPVNLPLTDEVSRYWDLWSHASGAGVRELADACRDVMANNISSRLRSAAFNVPAVTLRDDFAEILRNHVTHPAAANFLRARVFGELADRLYGIGEYLAAVETYRMALESRVEAKMLFKYLLLRLGKTGVRLRDSSRQTKAA
jgi:glycosyltransferase involved in cell wall biosynthesis